MKHHGWLTAETPKPRKAPAPSLGQDALKSDGRAKALPRATIEQMARQAQHARCVDHVEVEGLSRPVCVLAGQSAADVVAEALELAGHR
jgi:hypothetical protein